VTASGSGLDPDIRKRVIDSIEKQLIYEPMRETAQQEDAAQLDPTLATRRACLGIAHCTISRIL
jgi:hypothetical protein